MGFVICCLSKFSIWRHSLLIYIITNDSRCLPSNTDASKLNFHQYKIRVSSNVCDCGSMGHWLSRTVVEAVQIDKNQFAVVSLNAQNISSWITPLHANRSPYRKVYSKESCILISRERPEMGHKISSKTYHFLSKFWSRLHLNEEFSYIFYTFFKNLPEMKGKSPWCLWNLLHEWSCLYDPFNNISIVVTSS